VFRFRHSPRCYDLASPACFVLSPVVTAMEWRLGWSRGLSAAVLVLAIVIVLGAISLVVVQAIVGAVREFSDDLPRIVDEVRRSELGSFIDSGSDSLDTLAQHASEITSGVAKVSGGVADVGLSPFGAVTLVLSVMFLTLFVGARRLFSAARWYVRLSRSDASRFCSSPRRRPPRNATCSSGPASGSAR